MSDLDPESNKVIIGVLYTVAAFLIAWLAKILGFFGSRQVDRIKTVEEKVTAADSRINVLEATVVKDKELRQALNSLRKDVDGKLEAMNGNITTATDKFTTEHHQTRHEVKEDVQELKRFFTDLYGKSRKAEK